MIFGDANLVDNQRERASMSNSSFRETKRVINLLHEMQEESKNQIKELENGLRRSAEMFHGKIEDLMKLIESQSVNAFYFQFE